MDVFFCLPFLSLFDLKNIYWKIIRKKKGWDIQEKACRELDGVSEEETESMPFHYGK